MPLAPKVAGCITAAHALELLLADTAGPRVIELVAQQAMQTAQNFAGRAVGLHLFILTAGNYWHYETTGITARLCRAIPPTPSVPATDHAAGLAAHTAPISAAEPTCALRHPNILQNWRKGAR